MYNLSKVLHTKEKKFAILDFVSTSFINDLLFNLRKLFLFVLARAYYGSAIVQSNGITQKSS